LVVPCPARDFRQTFPDSNFFNSVFSFCSSLSCRASEITCSKTAQPAGLREPGGFCGAELSIPSSGRAAPSLRRGWTGSKQKHKLNHVPGLAHGLAQKSGPGQSHAITEALMSHRRYSLVPEHPASVLGTVGLRGFDWARSPAATLRLKRPPGRELNGSLSPRLALTRTHNQPANNYHLATPPQPHVRN